MGLGPSWFFSFNSSLTIVVSTGLEIIVLSCTVESVGEGNGTPLQYSCRKSHGWRSLEGCSPWGRWGSDMTERLHFHFSLSCTGERNGNPLQCSCLENPRDGGAWWAAVYGVAQSWTRLKWLSSSSSGVSVKTITAWHPVMFQTLMDETTWDYRAVLPPYPCVFIN